MLRQYVMTDSDASRGLLGIIGRTQDLMKELGRLRSEFVRCTNAWNGGIGLLTNG